MKKVVLSLVAVMMFFAVSAQAQVIKLSLWGPICVPNEAYTGGVEIGIGTETKEVEGVQFSFIYSKAEKLTGVQFGLVTNADDVTGVQFGFVNLAQKVTGVQSAAFNYAQDITGAQLGWVNIAKQAKGLQFGLVNYAETMEGLQLGLVNIMKNSSFLPVFVIFNFHF